LRANPESSFSDAASSGEEVATSGVLVSGLHPVWQPADFGRAFFLCLVCASAYEYITSGNTVAAAISAIRERIVFRENLRGRASAILACAPLHLASGHGVRIFAQGSSVSLRQNFHHPPVKIVHRMVHDRFEATVVLSMSFLNVVFQSDANVFVFAA